MSKPTIRRVWTFVSSSNPSHEYETLQYSDGALSCNCPGWTRRVASNGSRSCKHTRLVDMGRADLHCAASHDYDNSTTSNPKPQTHHHAHRNTHESPRLGHRKLVV
jgi:hypothetical protein